MRQITSEIQYGQTLKRIEQLMDINEDEINAEELAELENLANIVEEYEDKHFWNNDAKEQQ